MQDSKALEEAFQNGTLPEALKRFFVDEVPILCEAVMHNEPFAQRHERIHDSVFQHWEKFLFTQAQTDVNSGDQSGMKVQKHICGHLFRQNEPCFSCVDCATDPTCVLCRSCFLNSEHINHKYHMHTSSGNGYCDCGDSEAWSSFYHCRLHQPPSIHDTSDNGSATSSCPSVTNPIEMIKLKCEESTPEGPEYFFETSPSQEEMNYIRTSLALLPATVSIRFFTLYKELLSFLWEMLRLEVEYPNRPVTPLYHMPPPPPESRDYAVFMYNDEKHTFDQVEDVLTRCVRMSKDDAIRVALIVDRDGRSLVIKDSMTRCAELRVNMEERSSRNTRHALRCETWHSTQVSHQEFTCHILAWFCDLVERYPTFRTPISVAVLGLTELVGSTHSDQTYPLVSLRLNEKNFVQYFVLHHSKLWKNARTNVTQFIMSVLCQDILFRKLFAIFYTRALPTIMAKYVDDDHSNVDNIESVSCQMFTVISLATYLVEHENVCTRLLTYMLECLNDSEQNVNLTEPSLATIPPGNSSGASGSSLRNFLNMFTFSSGNREDSVKAENNVEQKPKVNRTSPVPKRRLYLEHNQEHPGASYQLVWHKGVRLLHSVKPLEYILRSLQDKSVISYSRKMWENLHTFWDAFLRLLSFGQDMIPLQRAVHQHVEVDTQVWSGLFFLDTIGDCMTRAVSILSRRPDHLLRVADVLIGYFKEEVMCAHHIEVFQLPLPSNSVTETGYQSPTAKRVSLENIADSSDSFVGLPITMVECVVSRDYISVFQPLVHCLAMVFHQLQLHNQDLRPLLQLIDADINIACVHVIERPLRVFVITAQTIASLWTLNGFTIAMLGTRYYNAYMPFIYWNLALLQQMACYMDPNHFLAVMLCKFELESYIGLIKHKTQQVPSSSKHVEVASRFLNLLYQILTHRCRVGVGVGVDDDTEYCDILLHLLCSGPKGKNGISERSSSGSGGLTHSQIQSALTELQLVDEKALDVHLHKVADEREHGSGNTSAKVILFEPKLELLKNQFSPYHFTYLPRDSDYAEEMVRKRLNDASGRPSSVTFISPRPPIPLTSPFSRLSALTGSKVFVNIVIGYLGLIAKRQDTRSWNYTGLELVMHIIATALYEDERQIQCNGEAPFLGQVQANPEVPSLDHLLMSVLSKLELNKTSPSCIGLVKWILRILRQVELSWMQKKNPSTVADIDETDASKNIDAAESNEVIAKRESEEIRKQCEREERKERMLKMMAERQRAFLEASKARYSDLTQNENLPSTIDDTLTGVTDEEDMETDLSVRCPSTLTSTTLKTLAFNLPPPLTAESHICILCQSKDEEGNVQRPLCVIANIVRSSVLSLAKHETKRSLNSNDLASTVISTEDGILDVDLDLSEDNRLWRLCRIYQPAANTFGAPGFDYHTDRPTISRWNPPEGTLSVSCGHVVHQECIEKTKVTTSHGNTTYTCSLCKRTGHSLLFLLPPSIYSLPPIFLEDLSETRKRDVVQLYCRPYTPPNDLTAPLTMTCALLMCENDKDTGSSSSPKLGYNLWLSSMFEWYMKSLKRKQFLISPPSNDNPGHPLYSYLSDTGRLITDDGDLQRLYINENVSVGNLPQTIKTNKQVLQETYNTSLDSFYSLISLHCVVESLWPSSQNHWSAILGNNDLSISVPPIDVTYSSMPQCLVYTLSVWERQLRAISPDRNFFNCLAEYQSTFLRALCRNTFLLHEPIFDLYFYPNGRPTLEACETPDEEIHETAVFDWKEKASLWCTLDSLFRDLAFMEGLNELRQEYPLGNIPLLEMDCVSVLVALIHSRHTQMEILIPRNGTSGDDTWSRALTIQLVAFAVRISATLHLVQIILCRPSMLELAQQEAVDATESESDSEVPLFSDEIINLFEKMRVEGRICDIPNSLSLLKMASKYLCEAMLPFLRIAAYIVHEVTDLQPPAELCSQGLSRSSELQHLMTYLGLPLSPTELLFSNHGAVPNLLTSWCNSLSVKLSYSLAESRPPDCSRIVIPRFPLKIPQLIELPYMYTSLLELTTNFKCGGKFTLIFLCLLCGRLVCARGVCCMPKLQQRPNVNRYNAGAEAHSCHYHNGYALMLSIFAATIYVFKKGRTVNALLDAPYRDQYGEQDRSLKRGNPLFLHKESYQQIQKDWLTHQYILLPHTRTQHEEFFPIE